MTTYEDREFNPAIPDITVQALDNLVKLLAETNERADVAEEALTKLNKEIQQIEGRVAHYLKELDRKNYESPHGKVIKVERWRVKLPADDRAKAALFGHLRERGIFERYATVNSNSLNALFLADWDEAKQRGEGMTFQMPGIEAPQLHESITFRKAKD